MKNNYKSDEEYVPSSGEEEEEEDLSPKDQTPVKRPRKKRKIDTSKEKKLKKLRRKIIEKWSDSQLKTVYNKLAVLKGRNKIRYQKKFVKMEKKEGEEEGEKEDNGFKKRFMWQRFGIFAGYRRTKQYFVSSDDKKKTRKRTYYTDLQKEVPPEKLIPKEDPNNSSYKSTLIGQFSKYRVGKLKEFVNENWELHPIGAKPTIKEDMVSWLYDCLFQRTPDKEKRKIEKSSLKELGDNFTSFFEINVKGKKFTIPRDIFCQIFSYMLNDLEHMNTVGLVNSEFYVFSLQNWERITITKKNLFKFPIIVLNHVREVRLNISSSYRVPDIEHIINNLNNVRNLSISGRSERFIKKVIKEKMVFSGVNELKVRNPPNFDNFSKCFSGNLKKFVLMNIDNVFSEIDFSKKFFHSITHLEIAGGGWRGFSFSRSIINTNIRVLIIRVTQPKTLRTIERISQMKSLTRVKFDFFFKKSTISMYIGGRGSSEGVDLHEALEIICKNENIESISLKIKNEINLENIRKLQDMKNLRNLIVNFYPKVPYFFFSNENVEEFRTKEMKKYVKEFYKIEFPQKCTLTFLSDKRMIFLIKEEFKVKKYHRESDVVLKHINT